MPTPYNSELEGFNPRTGMMMVSPEFLDDIRHTVGNSLFGTLYTHYMDDGRAIIFVTSNQLPEPGFNGWVKLTIDKTRVGGYTRNGYVDYVFHPYWEKDDSVVLP